VHVRLKSEAEYRGIDLSKPDAPTVRSCVATPGGASTIRVDSTHLLSVGSLWLLQHNDRALGLQLTGTGDNWSEILHRLSFRGEAVSVALTGDWTYDERTHWLAIPTVESVERSQRWSEQAQVRVFHVDVETGFTPLGAVSLPEVQSWRDREDWFSEDQNIYSISTFANVFVGDHIYSISPRACHVQDMQHLGADVAKLAWRTEPATW